MTGDQKKLISVVVLLLVAGAVYWFFGRGSMGGGPLPGQLTYLCVQTGEKFHYDRSDDNAPKILPGKNPKTGQNTLVPIYDDNGTFRITKRRLDALKKSFGDQFAEVNKYVDPDTLEVLDSPRP